MSLSKKHVLGCFGIRSLAPSPSILLPNPDQTIRSILIHRVQEQRYTAESLLAYTSNFTFDSKLLLAFYLWYFLTHLYTFLLLCHALFEHVASIYSHVWKLNKKSGSSTGNGMICIYIYICISHEFPSISNLISWYIRILPTILVWKNTKKSNIAGRIIFRHQASNHGRSNPTWPWRII